MRASAMSTPAMRGSRRARRSRAHDRVAEVCRAVRWPLPQEAGRRVCCFGTEARFTELTGWPALRIGDQPIWAPGDWAAIVKAEP